MPMLYILFAVMLGQVAWPGQARSSEASPAHYYFHRQPEKALPQYLKSAESGDADFGDAEGCLGLKARGSSVHAEAHRSVATLSFL